MLGISDHMDYAGQRLAERLLQLIMVLAGVVGWIYGYLIQDFSMTIKILGAGFILSFLTVMPPWPCLFRRNPLKWVHAQTSPPAERKKK